MVMKARVITEADRQVFDDYIASVPKGHILQSYEWGEVKARTGWEAIRLLVEEDGKPVAAVSQDPRHRHEHLLCTPRPCLGHHQ